MKREEALEKARELALEVERARENGIRAAASFAGTFDKQIAHPYCFEVNLLSKNLMRRKPDHECGGGPCSVCGDKR